MSSSVPANIADSPLSLLELPQDILHLIFPYLPPKSFLSFCSVNQMAYSRYRLDPFYWRVMTSNTFRLPISPLLRADGARWSWLYKKLKTQTRPFTWGQGHHGGLGLNRGVRIASNSFTPRGTSPRTYSAWPTEVYVRDEIGIIVDMQCGGWSTTVLTNDGRLFTVGLLDAKDGRHLGEPAQDFTQLQKFAQHIVTGVRQFSAGRCHVLGLDDSGNVWTWDRSDEPGRLLKFENNLSEGRRISRVAAGWQESSAYLPGKGIIFWKAVSSRDNRRELDYERTVNDIVVPLTGYLRPIRSSMQAALRGTAPVDDQQSDANIGEVLAHIVLESYIVFITHLSKIFASKIGMDRHNYRPSVFEVPGYATEDREFRDLQGSFRSFAVFTAHGEVLAGSTDYLDRVSAAAEVHILGQRDPIEAAQVPVSAELLASRPQDIPALQRTGVISLAFGDWHFHALHADGTITAYGKELHCCGCLGLGGTNAGSRLRGLKTGRTLFNRDARLLPIANQRGRRVWFEREKRDWLEWMESWIRTPTAYPHYPEVFTMLSEQEDKQTAFSEWVEQEGKHWSDAAVPKANSPKAFSRDCDDLPPYFAIAVAAAGWHSGALVLVDDEKAEAIRKKWVATDLPTPSEQKIEEEYIWYRQPFPRIRLPDGYEFPGEGEVQPWKDGMPTAAELGLGAASTAT